jgi:hypothetical protein
MATINQSPAGQAGVTLSGISFSGIAATGTPIRIGLRLAVDGGSIALGSSAQTLISASLRGKSTSISQKSASGMFTLDDQILAKRASAWPL